MILIRTSRFYGPYDCDPGAISIAISPPYYWRELRRPEYRALAPSKELWKNWNVWKKQDKGEAIRKYVEWYKGQLSQLDPRIVYGDLIRIGGEDPIIMCYEKPGLFCHRHLVSEWLSEALEIEICEV